MARTQESIVRQNGYFLQAERLQRRQQLARFAANSGILASAAAVVDSLSQGAVTKFYDNVILDGLGLHITTGNLQATRLPVAAVWAVGAVVQSVHANRRQNHINSLELLAAQEEQADRQATALELSTGQRTVKNARIAPGEQAPMFAQTYHE